MILVVLTLILILVGIVSYFVGAIKLAKYGFRISNAVGWAVILFPPYTFYFAFKKLEVDGKEFPTAMCCFGIVLTALLTAIFWQPLSMTVQGNLEEVDEMMTAETAPAEMTVEEVAEAVADDDQDVLDEVDDDVLEEAEELEEDMDEEDDESEAEEEDDDGENGDDEEDDDEEDDD